MLTKISPLIASLIGFTSIGYLTTAFSQEWLLNSDYKFDILSSVHWVFLYHTIFGIWWQQGAPDGSLMICMLIFAGIISPLCIALSSGWISYLWGGHILDLFFRNFVALLKIIWIWFPWRLFVHKSRIYAYTDNEKLYRARPETGPRPALGDTPSPLSDGSPKNDRLIVGAPPNPVEKHNSFVETQKEPQTAPRANSEIPADVQKDDNICAPVYENSTNALLELYEEEIALGPESLLSRPKPAKLDRRASDLRAEVACWLRDRGWQTLSDIYVSAGDFIPDQFDNDPAAHIPLIAISEEEIYLIFFVDLCGVTWTAVDTGYVDSGLPTWTARAVDGTALKSLSPIAQCARAFGRFFAHHQTILTHCNYYNYAVTPVVLAVNGYLVTDEAELGCFPAIDILYREINDGINDEHLLKIFGDRVDTQNVNDIIIETLQGGSKKAMKC